MGFSITSITVSMEISDTEYGNGAKRFASLRSESQDPQSGIPMEDLVLATTMTLDLLQSASNATQSARYAQGEISAKELEGILNNMDTKFAKVKKVLEG